MLDGVRKLSAIRCIQEERRVRGDQLATGARQRAPAITPGALRTGSQRTPAGLVGLGPSSAACPVTLTRRSRHSSNLMPMFGFYASD